MLNMLTENTTIKFRQLQRGDKIWGMLGTLQYPCFGHLNALFWALQRNV
jgi:hypothetical protein